MATGSEPLADIRARIARRTIHEYVAKSIDKLRKKSRGGFRGGPGAPYLSYPDSPFGEPSGGDFVPTDPHQLPKAPPARSVPKTGFGRSDRFSVGIVGAGMAGLYTAMILKSLEIKYEILEASDRIGGRVYTHRFTDGPGDYYDVGAMRFPDMPLMARTFDLFRNRLGIVEDRTAKKQGALIPYYFSGPANPSYFNNILVTNDMNITTSDPFSVSESKGGKVPDK